MTLKIGQAVGVHTDRHQAELFGVRSGKRNWRILELALYPNKEVMPIR